MDLVPTVNVPTEYLYPQYTTSQTMSPVAEFPRQVSDFTLLAICPNVDLPLESDRRSLLSLVPCLCEDVRFNHLVLLVLHAFPPILEPRG